MNLSCCCLPLTQVRITDGNEEQLSTTLGKIYADLADQHFEIEINALSVQLSAVTTATEKLAFRVVKKLERLEMA